MLILFKEETGVPEKTPEIRLRSAKFHPTWETLGSNQDHRLEAWALTIPPSCIFHHQLQSEIILADFTVSSYSKNAFSHNLHNK